MYTVNMFNICFTDPYRASEMDDTLETGGNSICWYGVNTFKNTYNWDSSCFCNTDLCNNSQLLCASSLILMLCLLSVMHS